MQPCVGITNVCPPLCSFKELKDGTYSLADVEMFHQTMQAMLDAYNEQMRALEQ